MTGPSLEFDVRGLPVAQGSARAFVAAGRAMIATEANRPRSPLGSWRTAIRTEAQRAMVEAGLAQLLDGPLLLRLAFRQPRPKSHSGARGLKPGAPVWVASAPDLDKLVRAALDALTGVVIVDDRLVARLDASKVYADLPGLSVGVWALARTDRAD